MYNNICKEVLGKMARSQDSNMKSVQTFISKDASDYLKQLAKNDFRSVAKYVQKLIMQDLKNHGYVEPEAGSETEKKTINSKTESIEKVEQSANNNSSVDFVSSAAIVTNAPETILGGKRARSKNSKVAPMNL